MAAEGWDKRMINVWMWVQETKDAGAVGYLETDDTPAWLPDSFHNEEDSASSVEEDVKECNACTRDDEIHGPRAQHMVKRYVHLSHGGTAADCNFLAAKTVTG